MTPPRGRPSWSARSVSSARSPRTCSGSRGTSRSRPEAGGPCMNGRTSRSAAIWAIARSISPRPAPPSRPYPPLGWVAASSVEETQPLGRDGPAPLPQPDGPAGDVAGAAGAARRLPGDRTKPRPGPHRALGSAHPGPRHRTLRRSPDRRPRPYHSPSRASPTATSGNASWPSWRPMNADARPRTILDLTAMKAAGRKIVDAHLLRRRLRPAARGPRRGGRAAGRATPCTRCSAGTRPRSARPSTR